jgi:hypothetical protein
MTRYVLAGAFAFGNVSCGASNREAVDVRARSTQSASPTTHVSATSKQDWLGVYASAGEISDYSGTVLALDDDLRGGIHYRMRFHSDTSTGDELTQNELCGSCLTDSASLYLPRAHGYMDDGEPQLIALIERYTFAEINGHKVLMRDDAHLAFRTENKLYDYGILIKVRDNADLAIDLEKVERPSIKLLYSNPSKPWNDPFVHGPNAR